MALTSTLARALTRARHRLRSLILVGLGVLGASLVSPVAARPDSRTIAISMVSASGHSFVTIAGAQPPTSEWYQIVATIERIPCKREMFHLGIVASRSGGLFQTSYDATIKALRVRTLRGRPFSCSRQLPRGIGRRLTRILIYPVATPASKAPFTIVGRRTSASGSRFTGRIEARDRPCPGRYRMRLTFSSGARRIVQRYELKITDVLVNGVVDPTCR